MKTKTILTLIAIIFSCSINLDLKGQDYIPFPEENAFWTVMEFNQQTWGDDTYIYTILGDTMVNGKMYKKIYQLSDIPGSPDTLWILHNLIRQKIEDKKVYFIRIYQEESVEKLGYNFDVDIGDTVFLPAFDYANSGDSVFVTIQPVFDSTQLRNGEYRKNYSFGSVDPFSDLTLSCIEGIGTQNTPFPNLFYYDPFHQSLIVCHMVNVIYMYGPSPYPDECDFSVRINEIPFLDEIYCYPQPSSDIICLEILTTSNIKGSLKIFNSQGAMIYYQQIIHSGINYTIDVSELPSGIYYLIFMSYNKIYQKKILIHH